MTYAIAISEKVRKPFTDFVYNKHGKLYGAMKKEVENALLAWIEANDGESSHKK